MADLKSDDIDKLLKRISLRLHLKAAVDSLELAISLGLCGLAMLTLVDQMFGEVTSNLIEVISFVGLSLLVIIVNILRVKSSAISAAVTVEREVDIPQTISTALYARQGGMGEEVSRTVLEDASRITRGVTPKDVIPLGKPKLGLPTLVSVSFFVISLAIPQMDLLGKGEALENQRQDSARVMRKEKALTRRLEKVSDISKKHTVSKEVKKTIEKVVQERRESIKRSLSEPEKKLNAADLRKELKIQRSEIAKQRAQATPEMKGIYEKMREDAMKSLGQKSPEMKQLKKALEEGDLGQASTALDALLSKFGDPSMDMKDLQKQLEDLLGKQSLKSLGKNLSDSDSQIDPESLEKLSRWMKDLALLDQVQNQIEFTEAELAELAKDWPKSPPPDICPDCLAGKCNAKSGGT